MDIQGKIIKVLEPREGTSSNTGKKWKVCSYVLETNEQYPKRVVFEVFGEEKISSMDIKENELLNVSFDIDAREYNGKCKIPEVRFFMLENGACISHIVGLKKKADCGFE